MATLADEVGAIIERYKGQLRVFMQSIRAVKHCSPELQAELLEKLDPAFAIDKELQEIFKKGYLERIQRIQEELVQLEERERELVEMAFGTIIAAKKNLLVEEERLKILQGLHSSNSIDNFGVLIDLDGVNVPIILALSERLSLSAGPPDGWNPDKPLILHRPPYPTEDLMRSSLLFQTMNVGMIKSNEEKTGNVSLSINETNVCQDRADNDMMASFIELDLNPDLL